MKTIKFISKKTNKILKYIKRKHLIIAKLFKIMKLTKHVKYTIYSDVFYLYEKISCYVDYYINNKNNIVKIEINNDKFNVQWFLIAFLRLAKINKIKFITYYESDRYCEYLEYLKKIFIKIKYIETIEIIDEYENRLEDRELIYDITDFYTLIEDNKTKTIVKTEFFYLYDHASLIRDILQKNSKKAKIIIDCNCSKKNYETCYYHDPIKNCVLENRKDYDIQIKCNRLRA